MTEIHNTALTISPIADHPGYRRVHIAYDLNTSKDDRVRCPAVTETIVLHGVNRHDAPIDPSAAPIAEIQAVYPVTDEVAHRVVDHTVLRNELDVEQDWWSSAQDGNVVAIAEWVDHLVAEIKITCNGQVRAEASTPVVSGSWGALGKD